MNIFRRKDSDRGGVGVDDSLKLFVHSDVSLRMSKSRVLSNYSITAFLKFFLRLCITFSGFQLLTNVLQEISTGYVNSDSAPVDGLGAWRWSVDGPSVLHFRRNARCLGQEWPAQHGGEIRMKSAHFMIHTGNRNFRNVLCTRPFES